MPKKKSAGLVPYRITGGILEVLLVHPGGPFWKNKDEHAWSIAKGEFDDEDPLEAAQREFHEETGFRPLGEFMALTPTAVSAGKIVYVWAFQADYDITALKSNLFKMEWPPRSKSFQDFPEVDRAEWFSIAEAKTKIHKGQQAFLDELEKLMFRDSHR
jgi:predicted NUDIX family NTP pyrophosphohydrolase